jgi:aldose 1-epimerase
MTTRALAACLAMMASMNAAQNYSAARSTEDGIPVVVLRDEAASAEVRIAPSLGNNAYEFKVKGKRVLWSPYSTLQELAAKPTHVGNPFLWPWANRIDGLSYFVNGRKYALDAEFGNVRPGPKQTPIHGLLVYESRWTLQRAEATEAEAVAVSRLDFWKHPDLMAQFPFANSVEMTYRLRQGVLEVETRVENHSAGPLPVSLGYHPYFQVNDAPRDQWKVTLPVKTRFKLSDRLIPTGETEASPYPNPVSLAGIVLDDVFGDLVRDADGFARFSVQGRQEKVVVEYGPAYHVAVVYAPAGRGFICFEPMSAITNAFNAAHAGWYKDLQSIPAGGAWREVFRVRTEGF